VVFSNAALQWVPDHRALFARLADALTPGGVLAVQMPANHDHPSHTIASEVAREPDFAAELGGYTRESPVMAPEEYSQLLHDLGFARQHVRMQVYGHVLDSSADVVEWTRGTLLTDYEARMSAALFGAFLERYRERLRGTLGDGRPFFYAFKRILMRAARPRRRG
jgi:trans-aconitate 2-methyltransferase